MDRGLLNISASGLALPQRAFMFLILPLIQRGGKLPFSCWRWWESSGEMCHLFAQLLCSMLGTSVSYCQSSTQGWMDICCISIHHSQFLRSSGTGLTEIWETCSTPCFHMDYSPPQETFPRLSPRHAQFSVLHCERCRTWDVAFAASLWATIRS